MRFSHTDRCIDTDAVSLFMNQIIPFPLPNFLFLNIFPHFSIIFHTNHIVSLSILLLLFRFSSYHSLSLAFDSNNLFLITLSSRKVMSVDQYLSIVRYVFVE